MSPGARPHVACTPWQEAALPWLLPGSTREADATRTVLTVRPLLEGVAVVVTTQQRPEQTESSGRGRAQTTFRFPGLSPRPWTRC